MLIVVILVGVVQEPEMDRTVVVKTDFVTVDGAGVGPCIDFGIDVGKVEIRQGNVFVSADN